MTHRALVRAFLLGFLALCLLLAYLLKASFDTTLRKATDDADNLAQILDGQLQATLRRLDASLQALAQTLPASALDVRQEGRYEAQVKATLRRYSSQFPELGGFYVWDAQGLSLYAPEGAGAAQRRSIAEREGFQKLKSAPEARMAYSDTIRGVISGQLTVVVYVPMRDAAGRLLGVVTGTLNLDHFDRVFRALELTPGSVVFVRRTDDHKLVLRYPMVESDVNKPVRNPLQRRIDAGETAGRDHFQAATDGRSRLYSFRKLGAYPFYVVVGLSEAGALQGWYRQAAVVSGGIALSSLLLGLLLLRMRKVELERESARQEAERAHELLHEAISSISAGITIYDPDDRLVMCNEAHLAIFDTLREEIQIGRTFEDITREGVQRGLFLDAKEDPEAWLARRVHQHLAADGRPYELAMHDGRWIQFSEHRTPKGYIVGSRIDITERKRLETDLREQASTDALTGLPNRRYFLRRLEEELERVRRRTTREACVLMLDLDHFKRINDQYGHAAGDSLLRHFANLLRHELRTTDTAGRMGGEEFAVILPGSSLQAALGFAQRICDKLVQQPMSFGRNEVSVTVSIGIASISDDDLSADAVLSRADGALYRAKDEGRNRVQLADKAA